MDRSECQRIVEAHLDDYVHAFGLTGWRILVDYCGVGEPDSTGFRPDGRCHIRLEYDRAKIELSPDNFEDADTLLDVLRHELSHLVTAPFRLYRDFAGSCVPAGSPTAQEAIVWDHADEQAVRALERLWGGMERYWRDRIAAEREAEAKARHAMPKKVGGRTPKVTAMYDAMVKDGMPKGKAAAISQAKTGQALSTGRKAKTHDGKPVGKAPKRRTGKRKSK